ncbi:putative disease resistance protein At4g19530 [Castanea sativa]|uniref:putative disease resistance protein At4g19530 n=1 Tax=Castanea sativa TaxID=21020 RepID=UPI003F64B436
MALIPIGKKYGVKVMQTESVKLGLKYLSRTWRWRKLGFVWYLSNKLKILIKLYCRGETIVNLVKVTWEAKLFLFIASALIQCEKEKIWPIFYDVEPSDVRKQEGTFEHDFIKHEQNFNEDQVKMWRVALSQVGEIVGWPVINRPLSQVIRSIC